MNDPTIVSSKAPPLANHPESPVLQEQHRALLEHQARRRVFQVLRAQLPVHQAHQVRHPDFPPHLARLQAHPA
jgi:hypothetical protein